MKPIKFYILSLLFGFIISCSEKPTPKKIKELPIKFTIVPETNDGLYYVAWKDTLGQSNGYDQFNRPIELWCIIRNQKNDTIGYYKGLSTAQKLAYFETNDTIVTLEFKTGMNFFSEVYNGSSEKRNKNLWDYNIQKMTDFKPIKLNILKELRQEQTIMLEKNAPQHRL